MDAFRFNVAFKLVLVESLSIISCSTPQRRVHTLSRPHTPLPQNLPPQHSRAQRTRRRRRSQ